MIKVIHNAETNERIEIELTPEELEDFKEREAEAKDKAKAEAAKAAEKAALLAKLSITDDEAKLLLG